MSMACKECGQCGTLSGKSGIRLHRQSIGTEITISVAGSSNEELRSSVGLQTECNLADYVLIPMRAAAPVAGVEGPN